MVVAPAKNREPCLADASAPEDRRRPFMAAQAGATLPFDLDAHAALLAEHLTLVKPDGPGPFPVVLQMHGCGGIQPMQLRYAEAARGAGFAAVVVDSLGPRGIGRREAQLTVCTGARLRGAERAVDLLAMLSWVKAQPWATADNVAAAGWSHGGWTVMDALAGASREFAPLDLLDAVKAVVLVYPYAGALSRTRRRGWDGYRPRVSALLGGRDAVVGWRAPQRALDRLTADGLDVRTMTLLEATHCFDDENASDPRTHYRPDLEEQARSFYVDCLIGGLAS